VWDTAHALRSRGRELICEPAGQRSTNSGRKRVDSSGLTPRKSDGIGLTSGEVERESDGDAVGEMWGLSDAVMRVTVRLHQTPLARPQDQARSSTGNWWSRSPTRSLPYTPRIALSQGPTLRMKSRAGLPVRAESPRGADPYRPKSFDWKLRLARVRAKRYVALILRRSPVLLPSVSLTAARRRTRGLAAETPDPRKLAAVADDAPRSEPCNAVPRRDLTAVATYYNRSPESRSRRWCFPQDPGRPAPSIVLLRSCRRGCF